MRGTEVSPLRSPRGPSASNRPTRCREHRPLLSSARFGTAGDLPVVGRFQGATVDNLAVYRPSNSTFYVRAVDGSLLTTIKFGSAGDLPVVGHFQGSAPDNVGRFRPSSATFAIRAHGGPLLTSVAFGRRTDRPLSGRFQ